MTRQGGISAVKLAELALKVWGVILIVGALVSIPNAIATIVTAARSEGADELVGLTTRAMGIATFSQVVAGIVVLVWADKIVALFESDTTELQLGVTSSQLQLLGFALVGVFVLVEGLQDAAVVAYTYYSKPSFVDQNFEYMWSRQAEAMVRAPVQIAAGAFLILGREALVRRWSGARDESYDEGRADAPDDEVNREG